ncbi:hypothetical protein ACFU99_05870 [Streptomyces sp. NPDC057654]|uniref:hypothetical protein n=1 Tax=Streptomyces sp. NPDC057654 TaxID=3346196 RepID=UPI0036BD55DD
MGKSIRKVLVGTYRWGGPPYDEGVLFVSPTGGLGEVARLSRGPNGYEARVEDAEIDWFESVGHFEDKLSALYATLRKLYGSAWPYGARRVTTTA